jgi:hypothetical protein
VKIISIALTNAKRAMKTPILHIRLLNFKQELHFFIALSSIKVFICLIINLQDGYVTVCVTFGKNSFQKEQQTNRITLVCFM